MLVIAVNKPEVTLQCGCGASAYPYMKFTRLDDTPIVAVEESEGIRLQFEVYPDCLSRLDFHMFESLELPDRPSDVTDEVAYVELRNLNAGHVAAIGQVRTDCERFTCPDPAGTQSNVLVFEFGV